MRGKFSGAAWESEGGEGREEGKDYGPAAERPWGGYRQVIPVDFLPVKVGEAPTPDHIQTSVYAPVYKTGIGQCLRINAGLSPHLLLLLF